jgi:small subunit ribosomal protein S17
MANDERGLRKERVGKVVSNKMNSTVVVRIDRTFAHPLYKKYVRRSKSYYAHDDKNRCNIGDTVRIVETKPISKTKRWRVAAILERAK